MLNRFRDHLGTAGLFVAIVALIAALAGGAIAANNLGGKATVSAKGKKGPRGPRGPQGPKGATGPAGANGTNGKDGINGTNGTDGAKGADGADGNAVLGGFGAPNDALDGVDGDFYIDTNTQEIYGPKTGGEWGSGTPLQGTDGIDGQPWTPDNELPGEATLTGMYGPLTPIGNPFEPTEELPGALAEGEKYLLPVSFPIPLSSAPEFIFVQNEPGGGGLSSVYGSAPGCPGVIGGVPQANPGKFCVYAGPVVFAPLPGAAVTVFNPSLSSTPATAATPVGAMLRVGCGTGLLLCNGSGVWAVTG